MACCAKFPLLKVILYYLVGQLQVFRSYIGQPDIHSLDFNPFMILKEGRLQLISYIQLCSHCNLALELLLGSRIWDLLCPALGSSNMSSGLVLKCRDSERAPWTAIMASIYPIDRVTICFEPQLGTC